MGSGGGPASELRPYQMRRGTRSVAGRLEMVGGWGHADSAGSLPSTPRLLLFAHSYSCYVVGGSMYDMASYY
jgi:hypothetical protein